MPGIILDSSTDSLILALSTPQPLFRVWGEAAQKGSHLFVYLSSFLEEHQISPKELSYIAVGRGPGSYTGTRAAVAAATGFSMATGVPLIHFPSLLAFLPPSESGSVAAFLEIKGSKDLFALFYARSGILTEKKISPPEISQELSMLEGIACKPGLLPHSHYPLQFLPEIALPRLTAWIEGQMQLSELKENLVYLQSKL